MKQLEPKVIHCSYGQLPWHEESSRDSVSEFLPGHYEIYLRILHPLANGLTWETVVQRLHADLSPKTSLRRLAGTYEQRLDETALPNPYGVPEPLMEALQRAAGDAVTLFDWYDFAGLFGHGSLDDITVMASASRATTVLPFLRRTVDDSIYGPPWIAALDGTWVIFTDQDGASSYVGCAREMAARLSRAAADEGLTVMLIEPTDPVVD